VLVHVDTERGGEHLINRRLAYVALSRGRYDAQLYTNDTGQPAGALNRDVSHRSAMETTRESSASDQMRSASHGQIGLSQ
jgi:ATP-dependent exoDNAse (exonuclease V) alpha subunit